MRTPAAPVCRSRASVHEHERGVVLSRPVPLGIPAFRTVHANSVPQSVVGEVEQLLSLGVNGILIDQLIDGFEGRDLFLAIPGVDTEGVSSTGNALFVRGDAGAQYDATLEVCYAQACARSPHSCK